MLKSVKTANATIFRYIFAAKFLKILNLWKRIVYRFMMKMV